jgi:hypothetical protein
MKKILFILAMLPALISSQNLVQAEYFFDTDPGYGRGIKMNFAPTKEVNLGANLYTGLLSPGFHTLYYRFKDDSTGWGHTFTKNIFINEPVKKVVQSEYFFDTDPGFGKGIKMNFASTENVNLGANLYTGLLSPGFHSLKYRFKDEKGWGMTYHHNLYKPAIPKIARVIYAFNNSAEKMTIEIANPVHAVNSDFQLDVTSLAAGNHTLYLWVQNTQGVLSDTVILPIELMVNGLQSSPKPEVGIFPNPASDRVSFTDGIEVDEVILCDMQGKVVSTFKGTISHFAVNTLPNGSYLLIIKQKQKMCIQTLMVWRE